MIRAVLRIGCKGIQLFRFNALCGQFSTRAVVRRRGAPRPIPRAAARTLRTESYSRELSETQELQGPQGLVGMQRIEAPRNAGIRETHRNARPQELQVCADRRKLGDPKDRRNSSDRRNQGPTWTAKTAETEQPEPQKPPESRAPEEALPCGPESRCRSAAPLPTSRRAVRPAPRPSRPPGRRNRADPYRRGSGDRRSRSPSGSPADRPCPGWRPR